MLDNNMQLPDNDQFDDNTSMPIENDIEKKSKGDDASPCKTYGAIFSPDDDGCEYSCEQYSLVSEKGYQQAISTESEKDVKKSHKKKGRALLAVVSVIMALALLSSAAVFGASLYARYLYYNSEPYETTETEQPDTNNVYIDTTVPKYTPVVAEPGTLLSMEEAIAAVKDSVVEITTETVNSGFGGFSQYVVSGAGSGVIITDGGYIITNNHVIEGASNIKVRLTDGSEYTATLVGTDIKTDVAVISIAPEEGKTLKTAVIGTSDSLRLGQTVIAIGNPLGELGGTVTDGIISSLAREIIMDGSGAMTLLQTNAAVSPGNSGGGLFDLYGRLVGVVNAKSTGEGIEGISFAIPVNTAWDVAQQIMNKGYVSGRPALPVTLEEVRYGFGLIGQTYYQVEIKEAPEESELKEGDIIEAIDGITVSTLNDISEIVATHEIGDVLTFIVLRNHRYIEAQITVVEYVPAKSAG